MYDLREIAIYALVAFGIGCVIWGLRSVWRIARILRSGGTSVGRVTKTRLNRDKEAVTTVRFLPTGHSEVVFEQQAPHLRAPFILSTIFPKSQISFFNGKEFKVFYDMTNPQRATISPWADAIYGLTMVGFGVVLLLFIEW